MDDRKREALDKRIRGRLRMAFGHSSGTNFIDSVAKEIGDMIRRADK